MRVYCTHCGLPPSTSGLRFLFAFLFSCGLARLLSTPAAPWQGRHRHAFGHAWQTGKAATFCCLPGHLRPGASAAADLADHRSHLSELVEEKIGRASCRERV